ESLIIPIILIAPVVYRLGTANSSNPRTLVLRLQLRNVQPNAADTEWIRCLNETWIRVLTTLVVQGDSHEKGIYPDRIDDRCCDHCDYRRDCDSEFAAQPH